MADQRTELTIDLSNYFEKNKRLVSVFCTLFVEAILFLAVKIKKLKSHCKIKIKGSNKVTL